MRTIMRLLAALLMAASLLLVTPTPAANATLQTGHEFPHCCVTAKIAVFAYGHQIDGNTWQTDQIWVRCESGCNTLTPGTIFNIDIRGSGGAVLWSKTGVTLPMDGSNLIWYPNRNHGKGAYWYMFGYLHTAQCGSQQFTDSYGVIAGGAGQHPAGASVEGC